MEGNLGDKGKAFRVSSIYAVLSLVLASTPALSVDVLPTGGSVTAGSGSIQREGAALTITQSSARMAIDWQSFSIGQGNQVHFAQPSASSVALNRVLGSDPSVIQGSLSANGQVFLVNPNGVLFTPTAQVNVGGIVASTLGISNADFMAGRYRFEGASANAVVNQGNIVAANGGSIALIAARVTNAGSLRADQGNVLLGAGRRVVLDLGGPVKLEVEQAALDALIEQNGAIKADGGLVYLTARSANQLASTVINHTGVIEAQTLATGEQGRIFLLGDMDHGRVVVGGRLDASAPNGGNGGFIETSAAQVQVQSGVQVTAASAQGAGGRWLIDPTDITIGATSCAGTNCVAADTIVSTLNAGTNVSIATASAGTDAGNITVSAPMSWTTNKLTLSAHHNINVNAELNAGGTGSLAFEYGQASADGAGSTYMIADGVKLYVPGSQSFTWKKGSEAAARYVVFDNSLLRFGNGTQGSINANGQLLQPFYFDNTSVVNGTTRNGWFKLTFSNYPLDLEVGVNGDGASSWNRNGTLLNTQTNLSSAVSGRSLEISGYKEGKGSVVSKVNLGFGDGQVMQVENTYTLAAGASYLKTDTKLTNLGMGDLQNVRLWVGTRDDYIATRDSQYKYKGNLTETGFTLISAQDEQAKALKITEFDNGQGAAVLFYSTSAGANTSISVCCSFSNATGIDPRTSPIQRGPEDGSYALFMRMPDLASNHSSAMTWYYAAGPVASLDSVVTQVSQSAGVTTTPAPTPAPVTQPTPQPLQAAVATSQQAPALQRETIRPEIVQAGAASSAPAGSVGGLQVVAVRIEEGEGAQSRTELPSGIQGAPEAAANLKLIVVNGGVRLERGE